MDTNILQALAQLLRQRQGTTSGGPPGAAQDPMFAIRQLAGGGVLGQGLARQAQALDAPGQEQLPQQQPTTLGALGAGTVPQQRPTFYRSDDPSTFSPEQLAAYMAARGIQKPSMANDLNALVARLLGRGAKQ